MEVAAKLATGLALSALPPLINKLTSYVGGGVTDEEMIHLTDFVGYEIEALTRLAQSDDLAKSRKLLEDLQAAALELEDLLDEYEYNQFEKQVCSSSSNPIKKFIPKFKEKLGPILPKSRLRIRFENLMKFVEKLEKIHPFITSRTDTRQPHANTVTPTTSTLLSPYFGRENQCKSIIDFLLDESHADSGRWTNIVPVIAIIGMGGSGKSHTAQHIYNDNTIKKHFDATTWVHVTRDFNVEQLTRKMIESATHKPCPNFENFDELQKELIESLSKDSKRMRFLLVLDDVWCEDKMKWDLLVGPLNEAARNGSKVIITTRIENIAHNLNAKKIHLEDLKAEECWSILKHYAFGNYEEIINDQELTNVGNQIISKVKHSPLALKVAGSSLNNKRSIKDWEKILNHKDALKETMDLLLFSFQCLPSHLQRCFTYCSLFPKGYIFNFYVRQREPHLISLWIAQGFIESTNGLTLEKAGMEYIEELLLYSFFEKDSNYGFVIHDLLHDLAENVSKKQCHRIEHHDSLDIPKTCIHLSLYTKEKLVNVSMSNIIDIFKLGNLRTLIILRDDGTSTNIFNGINDIFQNLTKLRALYVRSVRQMEVLGDPHIYKLKHLRYLHVKYDKKLPGSLTKLYHLQFLILITHLEYSDQCLPATLPQGFSNLINLRTLKFYNGRCDTDLDWLYYNSKMINIEKLTSLQNLKIFHPDGFNGMASLRNLSLSGSLSILNLENVKCKEEAEEAMLNQKKNMNKLIFEWSSTSNDNSNICEEVLEGLVPHRNLEKLEIRRYEGVRFPNWMVKENSLPCLQTLILVSCRSLKIVPFLPPRLQELEVYNCDELMQLPPLSDTLQELVVFECHELMQLPPLSDTLRTLSLSNCPKLMQLPPLSDTLRTLKLSNCPKLMQLPPLSEALRTLKLVGCPKLMPPSIFNKSPGFSDMSFLTNLEYLELRELPCLHTLTNLSPTVTELVIDDCPKLTSLGNLQRCTSLLELHIFGCPMLMREEPSLVEEVAKRDITNRFPQVKRIETDEPLLVLALVQQQAFSSVEVEDLTLFYLQRPFLHVSDEYFQHFSSLIRLTLRECAALPNLGKLSSLEYLSVKDSPDVESLPNLPVSLHYISMRSCPKLMEKYEEGGPLHNTISHIPTIAIY